MFVAAHEWSSPRESTSPPSEPPPRGFRYNVENHTTTAPSATSATISTSLSTARETPEHNTRVLYQSLLAHKPGETTHDEGRHFLTDAIAGLDLQTCDLPESPDDLVQWMQNSAADASARYRHYLSLRQAGVPRRYFTNRAHALYFLRSVAPTKLVDGAWLYGLLEHAQNPRFAGLLKTYVEELGEGQADKNHVLIYQKLLARYGLDMLDDLSDDFYTQGTLQLALGLNTTQFLPEVIGFNLGYEQLPLHLLITAYELNELNIDPYYFTLHITVDNEDSGHARRAVQAVQSALPRLGGIEATDPFWQRVRQGYLLSNSGIGTTQVIRRFDIEKEVVRILSAKSVAGNGAHSDYCRVGGRSVNEWLTQPAQIPDFLAALQQAGWIKPGAPLRESRFWNLLQGERAEMFGVFSAYELQVIHDWIRGPASMDGLPYNESEPCASQRKRRPTFRATVRANSMSSMKSVTAIATSHEASKTGEIQQEQEHDHENLLDPDLQILKTQLLTCGNSPQTHQHLLRAMSPSHHWTPAGLYATRVFCASLFRGTNRQLA